MKKQKSTPKTVVAGALKSTQNAITLVALVITIIVLLILAGVTINLTLGNNGIFQTAQKAAKNYTEAQNKELADLANFNNMVTDITQDMKYDKLSTKAKPGDYVKYTPAAKKFSMTPEQTGQDANQDFNTGDYTGLWQVLYNDAEHGLQIISADTVENLTLGASGSGLAVKEANVKLAYNNAVDTLNSFCNNYVDIRYAEENSGRSVGSNPTNPADATTDTEILQFKYNGSTESGCKVTDEKYKTDYDAMKAATSQKDSGIHNLGKMYYLASRYVATYSDRVGIRIRVVSDDNTASSTDLWYIDSKGTSYPYNVTYGVRPVVNLKNNILTKNGDGSKISPYELVAK